MNNLARRSRRNLVSAVLLGAALVAAGGTAAVADQLIGSRDVANDSLRSIDVLNETLKSRDIKNGTVRGSDVRDGSLTEADFRGGVVQGPQGETGAQGETGPQGQTGDTGPQGQAGADGALLPGRLVSDSRTGLFSDTTVSIPIECALTEYVTDAGYDLNFGSVESIEHEDTNSDGYPDRYVLTARPQQSTISVSAWCFPISG